MTASTESRQSRPASGNLQQWMRLHPLFSFFFIAYAFSWVTFVPYVFSQWGILPKSSSWTLFHVIHTYGPAVAAIIMIRMTEGNAGLARLRSRIRQWRAGWQWYLFVLVGIPMLVVLGISLQPGALASFQGVTPLLPVSYVVTFVAVIFGGGPLGEEPGWRGFALPRMQARYAPLRASLLLGVLWSFWHLADFLTPTQGGGPGTGLGAFLTDLPLFLLMVIALSIIFTWVFNHTGGSVFMAILLHASVNTPELVVLPLFPAVDHTGMLLAYLTVFGLTALLILILTRGRLGYEQSQSWNPGHTAG
jgi:membrane protease YdiL (CAAX protease family)